MVVTSIRFRHDYVVVIDYSLLALLFCCCGVVSGMLLVVMKKEGGTNDQPLQSARQLALGHDRCRRAWENVRHKYLHDAEDLLNRFSSYNKSKSSPEKCLLIGETLRLLESERICAIPKSPFPALIRGSV